VTNQRKPVPPNPGPLFKRLYTEQGRTLAEIMAEYYVSYRRLRGYLQAEHVAFREQRPRPISEPATREMIDDYARMGLKAMALKYHMDRTTLSLRLHLAGVEIRKPGRPRKPGLPTPSRSTTLRTGDSQDQLSYGPAGPRR
jgi:hypothetical protein